MFTVSFLREGVAKFRGWLDDLLQSAWEACQGTDLLIESPSTMAGVHIAEALQIPFFRAFTMRESFAVDLYTDLTVALQRGLEHVHTPMRLLYQKPRWEAGTTIWCVIHFHDRAIHAEFSPIHRPIRL